VVVVLAGEQARQLEPVQLTLKGVELLPQLGGQVGIALDREQLVGGADVVELLDQMIVARQDVVQTSELGAQPAGGVRVVPQPGLGEIGLELAGSRALAGDVKGTPWRRRPACAGPRCVR